MAKVTTGERIAGNHYGSTDRARYGPERKQLILRIDAAIRRAVKEAWDYSNRYGMYPSDEAVKKHIETKYGVKL